MRKVIFRMDYPKPIQEESMTRGVYARRGIPCAGKWRSICLGGLSCLLLVNINGEVMPKHKNWVYRDKKKPIQGFYTEL